ncbi:carbohydrate-binding module family 14 protein [Tropicibacter naphthalenivorans]|uniref:Chitin-binding type-2 domain-containing protein n=1 Tax=Tropicibacter naphthalenivorans TaxID=441103 RepID=A0A0P1GN05_9RHOB|nr:carbohydrate-binding module family 14 protein [Tropicibacter naphthalenivorans]CUH76707.1 hypothetical protein TRN7648_01086 [Tropicibacter naphthalenivorans]SMC63571.1 Chitin binding Peritrophin-A domain-containing protein [Tropicibacter naphthalenivorans]
MIKTLLVATALTVAPMMAFAQCSGHKDQAMTCAAGTVYDADSNSCKTVTG